MFEIRPQPQIERDVQDPSEGVASTKQSFSRSVREAEYGMSCWVLFAQRLATNLGNVRATLMPLRRASFIATLYVP